MSTFPKQYHLSEARDAQRTARGAVQSRCSERGPWKGWKAVPDLPSLLASLEDSVAAAANMNAWPRTVVER